ncbi:MAG TPA: O-acetyl-ADP-ribose deacetylase [Nevskiaceae bacterium]|nr:O-acetyl-ADP-ribose deacetylase [Nevskiaceae bacterium]
MDPTCARLAIAEGDITRLDVDAIVNAANSGLMGGGGVDGAIHAAAGPAILDECCAIVARSGPCRAGHAVITSAGRLPMRHIIHAVGPIWRGGGFGEAGLLANAYRASLALAARHSVARLAFPNISTGVYGYPKRDAATIAIAAVEQFLVQHALPERVIFCCFDAENTALYRARLAT